MSTPLDLLPRALQAAAPSLSPLRRQQWAAALRPAMDSAGVTTVRRVAMFIGQSAVESWGFTRTEEDLDYRVETIVRTWPTRYPTPDAAAHLAHNPEALANAVYGGRLGNGDGASGDGWLFRGRGLLQTTGRANYLLLAVALKMDLAELVPWLATDAGAARSAAYYWSVRGISPHADAWDVATVTRLINGGTSGLSDRIAACSKALAALSDAADSLVISGASGVPVAAAPIVETAAPAPAEPTADDLNAASLAGTFQPTTAG